MASSIRVLARTIGILFVLSMYPDLAFGMTQSSGKQLASKVVRYTGQAVRSMSPGAYADLEFKVVPIRSFSPVLYSARGSPNIFRPIRSPVMTDMKRVSSATSTSEIGMLPVARKLEMEFEEFTGPDLSPPLEAEDVTESLPEGEVTLGEPISVSTSSAVFSVKDRTDMVLKYQLSCSSASRQSIHPLVREFEFLERLNGLEISPMAYFVSGKSSLPPIQTYKARFGLDTGMWKDCLRRESSQVRYLALERVGPTLYDLTRQGPIPAEFAIQLGYMTVENLQVLHRLGNVIHNDIHWGNVALRPSSAMAAGVVLIDFGRSIEMPKTREKPAHVLLRRPFSLATAHSSPWEIAGFRPGCRDDVYRALFTTLVLMNGPDFFDHHRRLAEANPPEAFHAKADLPVLLSSIDSDKRRYWLLKAFRVVLNVKTSDALVDYQKVLEYLHHAMSAS